MDHNATADANASSSLVAASGVSHGVKITHHYHVECIGPDGEVKWVDDFDNLVTTAGKNKYLDATLKTGLASPAWYVGLTVLSGAYSAADTMSSHAGWTDSTAYSNSTRPAFTPGSISAGSVDNSASVAAFSINASATIDGAFLVDDSTKGGTTGTLLGVGTFSGGARAVQSGDTLNVTVTCSIS